MKEIDKFHSRYEPGYDTGEFRANLIQKLLSDHGGRDSHFNIWELVEHYFGDGDRNYEHLFFMQSALAKCMPILEEKYHTFLASENLGRYHIRYLVKEPWEAERHVDKFLRGAINKVVKQASVAQKAQKYFDLLPDSPLMRASRALSAPITGVKELEEKARKQLEESKQVPPSEKGEKQNENQDKS